MKKDQEEEMDVVALFFKDGVSLGLASFLELNFYQPWSLASLDIWKMNEFYNSSRLSVDTIAIFLHFPKELIHHFYTMLRGSCQVFVFFNVIAAPYMVLTLGRWWFEE
jgi:hypothetical protein